MERIVLLIDDDFDEFQILKDVLRDCAPLYTCCWAKCAQEAYTYLHNTRPAMIFLDINMPKVNGLDCLKYLKEQSEFKDIPVILYSTAISAQTCHSAHQLGAFSSIQKTSNILSLVGQLRAVLPN